MMMEEEDKEKTAFTCHSFSSALHYNSLHFVSDLVMSSWHATNEIDHTVICITPFLSYFYFEVRITCDIQ